MTEDKARIAERFARLKLDFQTHEADAADQAKWSELEKQSLALDPDGAQHRRRLATILGDLACKDDGAPYVARALFAALGGARRPIGWRAQSLEGRAE